MVQLFYVMKKAVMIAALLFFVAVNVLLVLPAEELPELSFLGFLTDKFQHAFVYGLMCLLFSGIFLVSGNYRRRTYVMISLLAVTHGVAMEFVQEFFTENRAFDVWDMVADAIGVVVSYMIVVGVIIPRKKIGPCRNRGRNQN